MAFEGGGPPAGRKAAAMVTAIGAYDRFREIYLPVYAKHLAACEERLSTVAGRPAGTLSDACGLTLAAGGKRLRPLLVFLSAGEPAAVADGHQLAAAAVELVHMATLVHDDVLDGAGLRRGKPTVVARYGGGTSTAAGDYLFSAAFRLMAQAGSPRAVSLLTGTCLGLSRGELLQMQQAGDCSLDIDDYVSRCALKTSSLFATACQLGAIFSGASPQAVDALAEFGLNLGLAFQVSDDILDFMGEEELTGKRRGTDVLDGTITLPLIKAMRVDRDIAPLIAQLAMAGAGDGDAGSRPDAAAAVDEVCRRVEEAGGIDEARRQGEAWVALAREALSRVSGELPVAPLELIAQATLERKT